MEQNFSEWLNNHPIFKKMNLSQFSRFVGISESAIKRHARGLSLPTIESLILYSQAFNIPLEELFSIAKMPFLEEYNEIEVIKTRTNEFGEWLLNKIEKMLVKKPAFAKMIGIKYSVVQKHTSAIRMPTLEYLKIYSDFFKIPLEELCEIANYELVKEEKPSKTKIKSLLLSLNDKNIDKLFEIVKELLYKQENNIPDEPPPVIEPQVVIKEVIVPSKTEERYRLALEDIANSYMMMSEKKVAKHNQKVAEEALGW